MANWSIPDDFWSLFHMPDGFWLAEKYFQCIQYYLGVVRSLPRSPCGLAGKRFPQMQEVVSSNPTEDKICFSHFT